METDGDILMFYPEIGKEEYFLIYNMTGKDRFLDPLKLFSFPIYDNNGLNESGFYAVGGELTPEILQDSYSYGIFPWYVYKETEPEWYCPQKRYVIYPEKIHVSHSMRNLINKQRYHVTIDKAFSEVIENCRTVDQRNENECAWLSPELRDVFIELHRRGLTHSVEVWEGKKLRGGFYGFFTNGIFQGESMFSLAPSASQYGLVWLCKHPEINGKKIMLIDTQFETPTFRQLGGEYISYEKYREIMGK